MIVLGLFMGQYIFPGADASCPLRSVDYFSHITSRVVVVWSVGWP